MSPELYVACDEAVHVVCSDGSVLRAARACLFILERLGWGWFARMLSLQPILWVLEAAYVFVARNRLFFSRFLFTHE